MIPLLLLQVALFHSYVDEARGKLGLAPVEVVPYSERYDFGDGPIVAWVPDRPNTIYVWDKMLEDAESDALHILAYHESCHLLFSGLEKRATTPYQRKLLHTLTRHCTIEAMEHEFDRILRRARRDSYVNRLRTVIWWRNRR